MEEVTKPLPIFEARDNFNDTLNTTAAALLTQDDPGQKAAQVLFKFRIINQIINRFYCRICRICFFLP